MSKETKVITVRGYHHTANYDFLEQLYTAFQEGYQPMARNEYTYNSNPTFLNHLRIVTLSKVVEDEIVEQVVDVVNIEETTDSDNSEQHVEPVVVEPLEKTRRPRKAKTE